MGFYLNNEFKYAKINISDNYRNMQNKSHIKLILIKNKLLAHHVILIKDADKKKKCNLYSFPTVVPNTSYIFLLRQKYFYRQNLPAQSRGTRNLFHSRKFARKINKRPTKIDCLIKFDQNTKFIFSYHLDVKISIVNFIKLFICRPSG